MQKEMVQQFSPFIFLPKTDGSMVLQIFSSRLTFLEVPEYAATEARHLCSHHVRGGPCSLPNLKRHACCVLAFPSYYVKCFLFLEATSQFEHISKMSFPNSFRASKGLVPKVKPLVGRRYKSGPYGYTQAKALVYSKYGEPDEVLS